jgi:hypothetical protein
MPRRPPGTHTAPRSPDRRSRFAPACGRDPDGDLATITAIDHDARTVTVALDRGGQSVEVPARYLDGGHLGHAYAMTAHR